MFAIWFIFIFFYFVLAADERSDGAAAAANRSQGRGFTSGSQTAESSPLESAWQPARF